MPGLFRSKNEVLNDFTGELKFRRGKCILTGEDLRAEQNLLVQKRLDREKKIEEEKAQRKAIRDEELAKRKAEREKKLAEEKAIKDEEKAKKKVKTQKPKSDTPIPLLSI